MRRFDTTWCGVTNKKITERFQLPQMSLARATIVVGRPIELRVNNHLGKWQHALSNASFARLNKHGNYGARKSVRRGVCRACSKELNRCFCITLGEEDLGSSAYSELELNIPGMVVISWRPKTAVLYTACAGFFFVSYDLSFYLLLGGSIGTLDFL